MLDIRLAINPWIAVQARSQQPSSPAASADSRSGSDLPAAPSHLSTPTRSRALRAWLASRLRAAAAHVTQLLKPPHQQQSHAPAQMAGTQQAPLFHLDPVLLEGRVDLAHLGGPLTAEETRGCITASHSLPGAPLATVLKDVRRFLSENPGEVRWWPGVACRPGLGASLFFAGCAALRACTGPVAVHYQLQPCTCYTACLRHCCHCCHCGHQSGLLQLVVLLVKADTIDVNVAGSKRFTQQDWAAAAEVFERELAGVQLVDEQQVRPYFADPADCCSCG